MQQECGGGRSTLNDGLHYSCGRSRELKLNGRKLQENNIKLRTLMRLSLDDSSDVKLVIMCTCWNPLLTVHVHVMATVIHVEQYGTSCWDKTCTSEAALHAQIKREEKEIVNSLWT